MTRAGLRYAAGGLAIAVAAIHLYWGFPRLVTQIQVGQIPDPRPLLFVASGIAIFIGIAQVLDGRDPRPLYLAGIGLMVAYMGGYVAWHTVSGHGALWPWGPSEAITHTEPLSSVLFDHLLVDPLALLSKSLELTLAGLLAALYRGEPQSADEEIEAIVGSP